jgi:serine/threonine protein kinase
VTVVPKPLDDRYEVIRPLGTGGMTKVFEAWDRHEGRGVAVKIPVPQLAGDMAFFARLRREARAVAELTHPNVAAVHGVEWQGPTGFVVTELVDGSSLWDMVASRGPMPPAGAAMVAAQACAALAAAHDRGLTHGHLTSANVLLCNDGRVKLTDFRLAQAAQPAGAVPVPEDDVRALGRCMVLMLSGWEPAGGEQVQLGAEIPAELTAIVARAAGNPRLGYRTAGELGRDLVRFLADVHPDAALARRPRAAQADLSTMALSRAVALLRSLPAGSPGEPDKACAPPRDRRRRELPLLSGLVGTGKPVG